MHGIFSICSATIYEKVESTEVSLNSMKQFCRQWSLQNFNNAHYAYYEFSLRWPRKQWKLNQPLLLIQMRRHRPQLVKLITVLNQWTIWRVTMPPPSQPLLMLIW